jgi:hypothetical protein
MEAIDAVLLKLLRGRFEIGVDRGVLLVEIGQVKERVILQLVTDTGFHIEGFNSPAQNLAKSKLELPRMMKAQRIITGFCTRRDGFCESANFSLEKLKTLCLRRTEIM